MNYYEKHIGDFIKKTAHLTMAENGAYNILLDQYYDREGPIPAEKVHKLARARTKEERAAVDAVLEEYFVLQDGYWRHYHCDEVLACAQARIKAAQENGKRGGRPPKAAHIPRGTKPDDSISETRQKPSGLSLGSENDTQKKAHQAPDTKRQEEDKKGAVPALGVADLIALGVEQQHAIDWLKVRKQKRAPLTDTALEAMKREAVKAGIPVAQAVQLCAERGWQGFNAEWVAGKPGLAVPKQDFGQQDYLEGFRGESLTPGANA